MTIPSDLTPPAGVQARSDLRRRAGLRFIGVTICLDVVSHTIVFPVLPKLVEELLGGDVQGAARWIGVLIAIWSVAQFVAAPVIGPVIFGLTFAWSIRHEGIMHQPGLAIYLASGLLVAAFMLALRVARAPRQVANPA